MEKSECKINLPNRPSKRSFFAIANLAGWKSSLKIRKFVIELLSEKEKI